ncbi:NADPH-dependent F420 reductase [Chitinophaga nivalis]|uniref:NAD(P)-binding domain-containing protein n=1 Tax=Chitinophaga nivalis TaxID=2991709 RepID=A0ABT3IKV5_9BACT|nr:NAD(P)-binding domain-containing protein [Chitinophaga nivalis]MCW3465712.1 NAD(P)-binding domain-containing protein [Chitinophaga nivalis]MCW3484597.1 NAD(P)-binding domain-containing protein [Chitinophaga nivalis]
MKIGILGSGPVGLTLGKGLIQAGHHVTIGTRNPAKESLQQWLRKQGALALAGTFRQAAEFGELILICTSWMGTKKAIEAAGIWNFKRKTVVDVTNPLDGKGPDDSGRLNFVVGHNNSAGEQIQAWLPPDANVVKALSCIGHERMLHPVFEEGAPTMFIAGNNNPAKDTVRELLHQIGWDDVVDMGSIEICRSIEPLSILWAAYGFLNDSSGHAFKLLKR